MTTSTPPAPTHDPPGRPTFVRATLNLGDIRPHPWDREAAGREELLDGLVAAAADPPITLWNPFPAADRQDAGETVMFRDAAWDRGDSASFAVRNAADGALLGNVTVRWTDREDGLAMMGYWTLPAARGQGVATRATEAVTDWAFATAGARRIESAHAVGNEPSCRIADRCGYLPEGTLRASHLFGDGAYHDEHLHARLATDPQPAHLP
ncbi:GNAT family N-acetyltransferase [Streptomyces sp. NPDC051567]|uniref:GNAT family N-acetyltransferase n=1 Tax=Streptomyces sp. NPDC051567 TaxID=3365660 RepID=UPI0037B474B1